MRTQKISIYSIVLLSKLFLVLVWLALPFSIHAQKEKKDSTLNRTVVVENEYNPDIMDASKINILPTIEDPVVPKKEIEYSFTEMPTNAWGTYYPMSSLAEKPLQANAKRGYARLGYGNYGNIDAKLSYLLDLSRKDRLGFRASLDGMNGTLDLNQANDADLNNLKWKSRYYHSLFNLDYIHLFNKVSMNIIGNFGMDNFNYHKSSSANVESLSDKQHTNKGELLALFSSTDEKMPLQFSAGVGYLYFGRKYNFGKKADDNENNMRLNAAVWGQINEEQKVGIEINMNSFFYTFSERENYTSMEMNPYYNLNGESWKLRIGAHVDLSFGKGQVIEVAPDVNIQYIFAETAVYLKMEGGRIPADYRNLQIENPYWAITASRSLKNTYIPLDAALGLKSSPFKGFHFDLFGGYQIRNNDLCFVDYSSESTPYAYSYAMTADTKSLYAGLQLSYDYKDLFNFSAEATYSHWDTDESRMLLMKPEFEMNFRGNIKVLSGLYLNLAYDYVTRPKVKLTSVLGLSYDYRMKPVNNLSLGATYEVWKGLSIYAKLNNLLNRKYQYYYSYPTEKLNFLTGVSYVF